MNARNRSTQLLIVGTLGALGVSLALRDGAKRGSDIVAAQSSSADRSNESRNTAPELVGPAESSRASTPVSEASSGVASSQPAASQVAPHTANEELFDSQLLELKALTAAPESYHSRALPILDRMSDWIGQGAKKSEQGDLGAGVGPRLERSTRALHDTQLHPLVRGTVFIALAPHLQENQFQLLLDEYVRWSPVAELELVRCAALAASRRGTASPCDRAISLAKLRALPTASAELLPGYFEFELDRVLRSESEVTLRSWLEAPDPRKKLFDLGSAQPNTQEGLRAAADYFATFELVYCVWSRCCLIDGAVQNQIQSDALLEQRDTASGGLISLRAAHFVLQSLAQCSPELSSAAAQAISSRNELVSGVARSVTKGLGCETAASFIERAESLRYSRELADEASLIRWIGGAQQVLTGDSKGNEADRELVVSYVSNLVADPQLADPCRAKALQVLSSAASWSESVPALRSILLEERSDVMVAVAIGLLAEHANSDAGRRREVLELLRKAESSLVATSMRSSVQTYIARLSK